MNIQKTGATSPVTRKRALKAGKASSRYEPMESDLEHVVQGNPNEPDSRNDDPYAGPSKGVYLYELF